MDYWHSSDDHDAESKRDSHRADEASNSPSNGSIRLIWYIDTIKLIKGLHKSAEKYGTMELSIPLMGKVRFNSDDVQRLAHYMEAVDAVAVSD